VLLLVLAAGALAVVARAGSEATDLPTLRRQLLEARDDAHVARALDRLTQRVGVEGGFVNAAAFGDWLGKLPDGRAQHPLVKLRRGWAYVVGRRGADAVPLLQDAVQDDPGDGLRRAYLGEALRQAGRCMDAATMLTAAVRCGYYARHLHDSLVKTLYDVRREKDPGEARDLPEYVTLAEAFLDVKPVPDLDFHLAQLLLRDFDTYETPRQPRGQHWAQVAGRHALRALRTWRNLPAGAATLAFDAAHALEVVDPERQGDTDRFDLLAWAWKLGRDPQGGAPLYPQTLVWMAEIAAREGRFALAWRLADRRLQISNSPRARRLLHRLPPDLGGD
jgi:hypothetical protein